MHDVAYTREKRYDSIHEAIGSLYAVRTDRLVYVQQTDCPAGIVLYATRCSSAQHIIDHYTRILISYRAVLYVPVSLGLLA
jgi:hypothetical protein